MAILCYNQDNDFDRNETNNFFLSFGIKVPTFSVSCWPNFLKHIYIYIYINIEKNMEAQKSQIVIKK